MSGSTENLLRNSHLSASKDSLDEPYYGTQSRQTKGENKGNTQGMENKGFQDDHRVQEPSSSSEMNFSYEPKSYQKRATSFQQRPMASSSKEPRRHSSPDHGHLRQERSRQRHGGRRRLSSNMEEDLRRRACLNSMKRHQSANPFPVSGREDSHIPSAAQGKGRQSHIEDRKKLEEDRGPERSSMQRDTINQREPPLRFGSSQQQDNEVQNMQQTIIALEKNQLEQYKKRLTLALSERAKLTEELQMLSQSLTQRGMESDRQHSSESISLGSNSRLSHSLGDLRVPEMYGDYGDISVDYENNLRLPHRPGSAQSIKEKIEIPELDLRSLNSSFERFSADHMENLLKEKEFGKNKESQSPDNNKNREDENEELKMMADDIWQDNLRGDVLGEKRRDEKVEDNIADENVRDYDVNNNEKISKKRLSVEEFLSNGDSKEKRSEKNITQPQKGLNILPGYEDMSSESRASSPGIYEPVETLFRSQTSIQTNDMDQEHKTPIDHSQGLLRLKVDDENSQQEKETPENYFTASTLPVEKRENRKEDDGYVRRKEAETNSKPLRGKATLNENLLQPRMTRIGRNERRFNYMVPPGARMRIAESSDNKNENIGRNERVKATEREVERVPSNISDKLRYYREKLSNRVEEEASCDLADAYAREKDPEKRREIQKQAASEAAMLRREASNLLFEAMNLERICDPNGRVKHVYLPH